MSWFFNCLICIVVSRDFNEFFTNATLNGTLTGHLEPQWNFAGSLFYCVTLISTIGWGLHSKALLKIFALNKNTN